MKYDLEIKRTFEKVALGVLKILGFEIVEIKTVPLEMQTGKIIVDFLAVVKLKNGSEYILHIEFQTKNDPDMPKRMLRYCSVIISRFTLPIIQIVIFLGKEELNMGNSIKMLSLGTSLFYEYQIIDLKKVEAQKFLSSDDPDVYLLGILGKSDNLVEVVRQILSKLKESFEKRMITKHDLLEYINRLGVFSELSK
ncbi:MAG: Rpn family recombination-promoting nuclease/putative transposase [bacterium]|nr:Rpn family recombination-promoting nuclease/putative transposase [bacterium]